MGRSARRIGSLSAADSITHQRARRRRSTILCIGQDPLRRIGHPRLNTSGSLKRLISMQLCPNSCRGTISTIMLAQDSKKAPPSIIIMSTDLSQNHWLVVRCCQSSNIKYGYHRTIILTFKRGRSRRNKFLIQAPARFKCTKIAIYIQ